ncbi:tail fiber protein [Salmonella enterica]|uniref:tail fiber protein n=3 Tax=Salmonella enterica TaxID=28901 RepID=UPI003D31C50A
MGKLTELEQWDEDVYQIETSDPVLGGPEGLSNRPQKQLANRTRWLKKQLEDANNALAEHAKSRNHPDATLTDQGFVKLYSGVTSMDETMAATPKAVKMAMDNANERLAKARNLADLQSVPLALANLTLTSVKVAVENAYLGAVSLPAQSAATDEAFTSIGSGYIRLWKNQTPGSPLPTDNFCYITIIGKRDANTGGVCVRVVEWDNPGNCWTGIRVDSKPDTKFTWARDFNSLNKPTPEDVGLAATKKAIDDTQTGLAVQGVMWISTADDLSNLPAGARRFARNNDGVTVLPAAGYFFLEVLAKRDVANGCCILATSDTRDVWIGFRYTVPDEAGFTWIQLNQTVQNLGLTETVKLAAGAVPLNKDGSVDSIKTLKDVGNIFAGQLVLIDRLSAVGTDTKFDVMFNARDAGGNVRWAYGPYKNGWDIHSYSPDGAWRSNPLHVDYNTSEVFVPYNFHVGGARIATDGNIWGTRWKTGGAWLWDTIVEQLVARDNNISARATWDWVNQNFVNNITLGEEVYYSPGSNTVSWAFHAPAGHVLTGINISDTGSNSADNVNGVYYKPIQKKVNGVTMTIAG